MKFPLHCYIFILSWGVHNCYPSDSFVISSTEKSTKETETSFVNHDVNPKINSLELQSNISNRFATTLVTSKVSNSKNVSAETTFSVLLPENAFISEFSMEINGKIYKAFVKEKEEAKQIYNQAVSRGQSAAHVEVSARDSRIFRVSVNIEPESKTTFRLTYEELLQREFGHYELILNIHPGQIVDDLTIRVAINESRPLTMVYTPPLRTGNEISKNDEKLNPEAEITMLNNETALITFEPSKDQQKAFATGLGTKADDGFAGQFVVQYDVQRDPQGGEVLVRDGYFVHFFSPAELEPLPKHVVFVLDHSGSMDGTKFSQLIDAMQVILSELRPTDIFHLVRFGNDAKVWYNDLENKFKTVELGNTRNYGNLEPLLRDCVLPEAVEANPANIAKAKAAIKDKSDLGMTNIMVGLEVGLFLVKSTKDKNPTKNYQPMIMFLTDGEANKGVASKSLIIYLTTKINAGPNRTSIFSLSFGETADKKFLQNISLQNLGFSTNIYEAADASLQLQSFFRKISSPLLSNITFKYVEGVSDLTATHHPIYFNGSELVVAGRTTVEDISPYVHCNDKHGIVSFKPLRGEPVNSLERLWAYLTVKDILKQRQSSSNKAELTKKALDLSLKYSFVTAVSSLVVVKSNETHFLKTEGSTPKRLEFDRFKDRISISSRQLYSSRSPYWVRGGSARSYHFRNRQSNVKTDGLVAVNPILVKRTPQWIQEIQNRNGSISSPLGDLKLGKTDTIKVFPPCSRTPLNGTSGECRFLFECSQVFPFLIDVNTYLQFSCSLDQYAGVCCPNKFTRI